MAINPILVATGFHELDMLEPGRETGTKLMERAKKLLVELLCSMTSSSNSSGNEDNEEEDSTLTDLFDVEDPRERLRLSRLKRSKKSSKLTFDVMRMRTSDREIAEAVDRYFHQCENMDVEREIKEQVHRLGTRGVNWSRVKELDALYISSKFDLSEWWHAVGRKSHELLVLLVAQFISIPPSNGFQERVFSACTYFDGAIQQNLKDERYEMKVLLSVNERLAANDKLIDPVVNWSSAPDGL